jgi:hypothetical protein
MSPIVNERGVVTGCRDHRFTGPPGGIAERTAG